MTGSQRSLGRQNKCLSRKIASTMPKASQPRQSEASRFGSSAWSQPVMRREKWKRREKCLSEASCFPLPFFASQHWEARRAWIPQPPSFAYFSWRSKKSERLPGRPRHRLIEERTESATHKRQVGTTIATGVPTSVKTTGKDSRFSGIKKPPDEAAFFINGEYENPQNSSFFTPSEVPSKQTLAP